MDDELPINYATNTLHFEGTADTPTAEEIADAVDAMYSWLGSYWSSLITPSVWVYKFFDLDEPEPRVPFAELTGRGPASSGTTAAPPELALCMSWKAEPISGFPAGRLRNRIYIGPLAQSALNTDGRPAAAFVTALAAAGQILLDASELESWDWVVYSPTQAAASQPPSFPIMEGWVDNEFDIQRRRGRAGTARSLFQP